MSRLLAASLVLLAASARADGVPAPLAVTVMLKLVSYDTAFAQHGEGDFVVAVPFDAEHEREAGELVKVCNALEVKRIKERTLRFVAVAVAELESQRPNAVLFRAGASSAERRGGLDAAKKVRAYALALDEAVVKDGAVLGVGLNDGKPQPLINVSAARALSADFGAALRLARIVQ